MTSKRVIAGLMAVVVIGLLAWLWLRRPRDNRPTATPPVARTEPPSPSAPPAPDARTPPARTPASVATSAPVPVPTTIPTADAATTTPANRVFATAAWGSRPGELGHERLNEGNAEGPMSMAPLPNGGLVVLDQVNHRLVRYGPDGRPAGTLPAPLQAPQDVAVSRDGTIAVLDRLGDQSIAVLNPDGTVRSRIPVVGNGIPEGGGVTAMMIDGQDVYLEREHGTLIRVGDLSGTANSDRQEVSGRPTRDGLSYINAGVIDMPAGRFYVNSVARDTGTHRFTRELRVELGLHTILLLDTDRAGVIYVAVAGEIPGAPAGPDGTPALAGMLVCLEPTQGRPMGQVPVPVNTMPEETFRDMVVLDEGGVVYSVRSEQGVSLQRYDCR